MGYFNEFPHTRNYDGDLGYLIKMYKKLVAEYASIEEQYKVLVKIYEQVQNDIEDVTIEQLQKWLSDGTLENIIDQSIIDKLQYERINVKSYGAKGDGKTDDTDAILDAISHMTENSTLFFPNGDYIVYSDYENNHGDYGYDYDKCIKIVGLKNIAIEGEDRNNTRIRPPLQSPTTTKYNYPCTLSVYQCQNVTIKNITVENKGENYGDTDAISSIQPQKGQQMIANGGQDLLILDSSYIWVENCNFRICGSVGCLYGSNTDHVTINNCFTNAMSLGYAGICFDDFLTSAVTKDYAINIYNCYQWAETIYQDEYPNVPKGSFQYSGKCGILIEGSDNNVFKTNITDYICYAVYGNSDDRQLGNAIISANNELNLSGLYARDVDSGVQFQNVYANNTITSKISNANIIARINGIGLYENINNGNNKVIINDCYIEVTGTKYSDNTYTSHNACILTKAYTDTTLIIKDSTLLSPEYGLWFPQATAFSLDNCHVEAVQCILAYTGALQQVTNNLLKWSGNNPAITVNTVDSSGAVGYLNILFLENIFWNTYSSPQLAFRISNTNGNESLIQMIIFKNNSFRNSFLSGNDLAGFSRSIMYGSFVILSTGLSGSYTQLNVAGANNDTYFSGFVLDDNGTMRKIVSANNNIIYIEGGDVRSSFTIGKRYTALGATN